MIELDPSPATCDCAVSRTSSPNRSAPRSIRSRRSTRPIEPSVASSTPAATGPPSRPPTVSSSPCTLTACCTAGSAYDPDSGARHLQNVYMEFDDLMARRRVLRGEHQPIPAQPLDRAVLRTPNGVEDGAPADGSPSGS